MKRSNVLSYLLVSGLLIAAATAVSVRRYMARPFFAGRFCFSGEELKESFILPAWSRGMSIGFSKDSLGLAYDLYADYDIHDHVLLLVPGPVEGSTIEWGPVYESVSEWLRIHNLRTDVYKQIEWRRDCLIYLDRDGTPTYVSLPVHEFHEALAKVGMEPVAGVVRRLLQGVGQASEGTGRSCTSLPAVGGAASGTATSPATGVH
jgi:hypothetical protein